MIYFIINLILHAIVSFILLMLLLRFVKINRKRKNKRGFTYLLPVVVTIVFILHGIYNTFPKMGDFVSVIKNTYPVTVVGTVESIGFANSNMMIDGKRYYFNPFTYKPKQGDVISGKATQYAHYITGIPGS